MKDEDVVELVEHESIGNVRFVARWVNVDDDGTSSVNWSRSGSTIHDGIAGAVDRQSNAALLDRAGNSLRAPRTAVLCRCFLAPRRMRSLARLMIEEVSSTR
ncbi:MAG: hypothetical protein ACRCSN_07375 [Dermatophilaceae bacterium]